MMKCRQVHHKSKNASWLGEGESLTAVIRRSKFWTSSIFFKSNGPVLVYCVDEDKTIDQNYEIEN